MPSTGVTSRGIFRPAGTLVLLCLLVWTAHGRVLQCGFINLDDDDYVVNNPRVTAGLTLDGVRWAFRSVGYASNWHPLTWISHMTDVSVFALRPSGHHLTSLLLHTANAVLLFAALRSLTGALWRSFFVAALFGVHPLHVESVAWIAERKDVLAGFFFMGTLLAWGRAARRPSPLGYLAAVLIFSLGLMAKASVIAAPLVLLAAEWWPLGKTGTRRWWLHESKRMVPLLALSAMAGWITLQAQQRGGATQALELSFWSRAGNALVAYAVYPLKALLPHGMAVFYPHPGVSLPAWKPVAAALVLSVASWLVLRERHRRPFLAVGWFWYLVTLLPAAGLVQVGWQATADRYTYLPLVGLFIMAAWGLADVAAALSPARTRLLAGLAAVWLLGLSAASWVQTGYWRTSELLFEHAIAVTGGNWLAEYSLGVDLWRRGLPDRAENRFRRAILLKPDLANAFNNLGAMLLEQGRETEAVPVLSRAVELNPLDPLLRFNRGLSLERADPDRAAIEYRQALALKPDFPEARIRLAIVLRKRSPAAVRPSGSRPPGSLVGEVP